MKEGVALLKAAHKLDEEALTAIFDQFAPAIYKYTLRLCHDPIVADNIVGDVFAQLLEQFGAGKGPRTNLRSYLYQTAYHLVVDRSRDNQHTAPLEVAMGKYEGGQFDHSAFSGRFQSQRNRGHHGQRSQQYKCDPEPRDCQIEKSDGASSG